MGFFSLTCFLPHHLFFLLKSKRREAKGHLKVPSIHKLFYDLVK